MSRDIFTADHRAFREMVRAYVANEIEPRLAEWSSSGRVDSSAWLSAGNLGLLAPDVEERYGGGGVPDYRYHVIRNEEMARECALSPAFYVQGEVVAGYLASALTTEEQKLRWLPDLCSGRKIYTIAITEPGAGSDVTGIGSAARPQGDGFMLTGQKTFVTHGSIADRMIVAAHTTAPGVARGSRSGSLFLVESTMPGVTRGRTVAKIGLGAMDTAEIFLDNVYVPRSHLIGEEGSGFLYLSRHLPRERLSIAVCALALAERAFADTVRYSQVRATFGKVLAEHQHIRFQLAEMATSLRVARAFTDQCITSHNLGALSGEEAAMVKLWNTELCQDVTDRCLQLHGGYGYTAESVVGRAFIDARAQTIYGGTSEIMKEIIGQSVVASY
jgi:alkylation response protein AidB-like acyl-CoA dehydrogenase